MRLNVQGAQDAAKKFFRDIGHPVEYIHSASVANIIFGNRPHEYGRAHVALYIRKELGLKLSEEQIDRLVNNIIAAL